MTDNPEQNVRTRTEGHIFEVTLDRPKANAIDLVTSRRMGEVFRAFATIRSFASASFAPPARNSSRPAGT